MEASENPFPAIRRIIKKRGWTQEKYQDGKDGPVCLKGAVNFLLSGNACYGGGGPTQVAIWDIIQEYTTRTIGQLPLAWNDFPGRTEEDVLTLLSECAEMGKDEA